MVRRGEGTWCHAEIIQKRINDTGKEYEYYVHYENHNRRLDEWVLRDRVMVSYDGLEVMCFLSITLAMSSFVYCNFSISGGEWS